MGCGRQYHRRSRRYLGIMKEVVDIWPILSGVIAVAAVGVAFRAEILVRVKVLEDKVQTLFELFNKRN
jgi:uncharacterized membrane protein